MPRDLKIATAQFENRSGDKAFNLSVIDHLSARAAQSGADAIAFHECAVTGYTFARRLSKAELWELAEPIPSGPSIVALTASSPAMLPEMEQPAWTPDPHIAALLQGERLAPPVALPPLAFGTREVELVRPMLVDASRSWALTQAKKTEFPLVFVAGEPLGGLDEVMQLDVRGELVKKVFG